MIPLRFAVSAPNHIIRGLGGHETLLQVKGQTHTHSESTHLGAVVIISWHAGSCVAVGGERGAKCVSCGTKHGHATPRGARTEQRKRNAKLRERESEKKGLVL